MPKSERMREIPPKFNMQHFMIALATVLDSLLGTGIKIKYLENSQAIVIAFFSRFVVVGKWPIVSIETDENGILGVSVVINGSLILGLG